MNVSCETGSKQEAISGNRLNILVLSGFVYFIEITNFYEEYCICQIKNVFKCFPLTVNRF